MSRTSKRSRYDSFEIDEPATSRPKRDVKQYVYIKGDSKSIGDIARSNPSKFLDNIKYVNGGIPIKSEHIKCDRHIVRITCTSTEEQERLLDVANMDVTISRPYAGTKREEPAETVQDVFYTYKYVISGVPIDVRLDEIKEIAECESVTRISRRTNGTETSTETCILVYNRELVLPVTLKCAFLLFKIRKYISNPRQCRHCFKFIKFGHTAKHCRHTVTCSNCSERDHVAEQCTAEVQKCTNCGGKHPADSKIYICKKYVQIKHILAVADTDKLSYKDAVKKVATTSKTLPAKTVEINRETTKIGLTITSARPIDDQTPIKTAVSKETSARLEAKLDLVLTQIATLSSQFNHTISVLRQEVSERYHKITDELTTDAKNREKHLDA